MFVIIFMKDKKKFARLKSNNIYRRSYIWIDYHIFNLGNISMKKLFFYIKFVSYAHIKKKYSGKSRKFPIVFRDF